MEKGKIWFTADIHYHHKNIMYHCPNRLEVSGAKDENDIETHDKWLIELWNDTISKEDTVYILGDFSFATVEDTKKLLGKLHGKKFLILGNHDKSSQHLDGYFEQITQIKEVVFKKNNYPFLDETFKVVMCHYPMLDWPEKFHDSVMAHGHCHGNMDKKNSRSDDMRFDVGLDSEIGTYGFVSLNHLYELYRIKRNVIEFKNFMKGAL